MSLSTPYLKADLLGYKVWVSAVKHQRHIPQGSFDSQSMVVLPTFISQSYELVHIAKAENACNHIFSEPG
jgi:hypothetical protein